MWENRLFRVGLRKDRLVMLWVFLLSVLLAILLVRMNAFAAVCRSRNVVSFFPADTEAGEIAPLKNVDGIAFPIE